MEKKCKEKSEGFSVVGLVVVLCTIAVGVAAVVYWFAGRRRRLYEEKWKDYDECGLT